MEFIKMERNFFEMQMANLSLNYRQKIEMKMIDWYWEHFKKYDKEKFDNSLKDIIETEDFFPTIAVIKRYLDKSKEYPEFKSDWPEFKDIKDQKMQIGRDSLKLILSMLRDEINKEEYYQGMLGLEKKYPNIQPPSFGKAAELYKAGRRYNP